jgi:hypothetical protein
LTVPACDSAAGGGGSVVQHKPCGRPPAGLGHSGTIKRWASCCCSCAQQQKRSRRLASQSRRAGCHGMVVEVAPAQVGLHGPGCSHVKCQRIMVAVVVPHFLIAALLARPLWTWPYVSTRTGPSPVSALVIISHERRCEQQHHRALQLRLLQELGSKVVGTVWHSTWLVTLSRSQFWNACVRLQCGRCHCTLVSWGRGVCSLNRSCVSTPSATGCRAMCNSDNDLAGQHKAVR